MASTHPEAGDYPGGAAARGGAVAEIAAAWRRELPGARTESIEVITPVWRIAKVLADDRRRTLAALGVDPSTLDLLSVIRRAGPPLLAHHPRDRPPDAGHPRRRLPARRPRRAFRARGRGRRRPLSRRAVAVRLTEACRRPDRGHGPPAP